MNNGYLLVPGRAWPVGVEFPSAAVLVPEGTTNIRFSLVSYQPTRERPQFGGRMQALWTDATKSRLARAGVWQLLPRDAWDPIELAEGLPKAGHEVGQANGIVPHNVGAFEYDPRDSPAVDGNDRPEWATHALVIYELWGGNNGSEVHVSVVAEAFAAQPGGEMTPLEFS
jgi:hypothetical protein